jgi:hypothetical protein
MTLTPDMAALLQQMYSMSAGDLSTLEASLGDPGSKMVTSPGSPNDALWSRMVSLGWMSLEERTVGIPEGPSIVMKEYRIEPEGRQPVTQLMAALLQDRKMTAVCNDVYKKIIPQIVEPVQAAGGSPHDFLIILQAVVSFILNAYVKSEARDQVLDKFCAHIKGLIKK